ncbi:hypothetical protein QBC46DRAFT_18734 [Diplogelasinospora grovesii]|uniref:Zn(2)-C6 fungal-type domain-containing protein n=1 Tax=Diplogelasinospora grovesii TaxID=303347 RepID=A0AAN6N0T4_9PEZI|nr:hypothetical protein QBC46DRAFT_18734 [Diplogelasinospora grovesii]
MPPRRSHKKSRAGCRRCKARKIKCDEVHPRCGNCVKHGVPCDFEHPEVLEELRTAALAQSPSTVANTPFTPAAASPVSFGSPIVHARTPASASGLRTPLCRPPPTPSLSAVTPAGQRLLELRLMHQYTAETCKTFTFTAPVTEDIWKITVPNLAFSGSQHLTDAILAVAALHLRSLAPNDKDVVRASHAYMAASLAEYSAALARGIDHTNAESLFLTAALIAFQSTATRVFMKDELNFAAGSNPNGAARERHATPGCYNIPFAWFHSFQGVKAITAASWQFLRASPVVTQVINSQAVLQLDFASTRNTFFGHLLEGLEDELAAMGSSRNSSSSSAGIAAPIQNIRPSSFCSTPMSSQSQNKNQSPEDLITSTRQAYQHAVAVLNWAHKVPHKGAPLAFPATVSRRYIELLEERRPRALAILACFFALLKSMDGIWWLHGMARREVLGVLSLFNSDYFGPQAYNQWSPHLEWATRIALYPDDNGRPIPSDVWGADWYAEERNLAENQERHGTYFRHIEMLSQMVSPVQCVPPVPD